MTINAMALLHRWKTMTSAVMASPFLRYVLESMPTGSCRIGGVPRGKEFAPDGTEACCKLHAQVFLIA